MKITWIFGVLIVATLFFEGIIGQDSDSDQEDLDSDQEDSNSDETNLVFLIQSKPQSIHNPWNYPSKQNQRPKKTVASFDPQTSLFAPKPTESSSSEVSSEEIPNLSLQRPSKRLHLKLKTSKAFPQEQATSIEKIQGLDPADSVIPSIYRQPTSKVSWDQLIHNSVPKKPKNPFKKDFPIIKDLATRVEVIDKESSEDTKSRKKRFSCIKKEEASTGVQWMLLESFNLPRMTPRNCLNENSAAEACFDYFGLTLYWPPTSAVTQQSISPEDKARVVEDWVIREFLPVSDDPNGVPDENCNRKSLEFNITKLEPIEDELKKAWFSLDAITYQQLWEKEFDQHGTCASRSVLMGDLLGYFKLAINLRMKGNLMRILEKGGFKKGTTMKFGDIYNLISGMVARPLIEVFEDPKSDKAYLAQVSLCYDHRFRHIHCKVGEHPHSQIWEKDISYLSKDEI